MCEIAFIYSTFNVKKNTANGCDAVVLDSFYVYNNVTFLKIKISIYAIPVG